MEESIPEEASGKAFQKLALTAEPWQYLFVHNEHSRSNIKFLPDLRNKSQT